MTKLSNVDAKLMAFGNRLFRLEAQKRECAEDIKEIGTEMKSAGISKIDIDGVKLAVRRSFEAAGKRVHRISVNDVAESLGDFANMPLGVAAIERAREDA